MSDQDSPLKAVPRRRVPVVTAVLVAAAILSPFVPLIIGVGGPFATAMLAIVPPALGIIGGALALLHRSLEKVDRIGWAVVSVITGFVMVPVAFRILTRILGP